MRPSLFYLVGAIALVATVSAKPLNPRGNSCVDDTQSGGDQVDCEPITEGIPGGLSSNSDFRNTDNDPVIEDETVGGQSEVAGTDGGKLSDVSGEDVLNTDNDPVITGEDVDVGGQSEVTGTEAKGSSGSSFVNLEGLNFNTDNVGTNILNRLILENILSSLRLSILGGK